ncbi:MAG: branched-chain amino acid aminotransferase [Candidatus Heimdallarchaeota archaeon]|nr:branched-chain amino acid aminotransferase [Candidatus Heimdallarchaeota archaeon]
MAIKPVIDIDLEIEDINNFKPKPNDDGLRFGKIFTDRMLLREFKNGKWETGKIMAYQNFSLNPATMVFHYGQELFEGLKAFYHKKTKNVCMFRPDENAKRMNASAKRLVMPEMDVDYFLTSISKLIDLERDWVPKKRGTALYIRPTMIASEVGLGVHPSNEYYFYTILSPSGPYFPEGFAPTSILVEDTYVRAAIGGTGSAKAGGNYAASLLAGKIAKDQGYSQVLWLDSKERKYVEEVGAMNIAFVIDDEIYTPELTGSILPGITRKSVIQLSKDIGYKIHESKISIESIIESIKSGSLTEVFGIGTAASIAPVGKLKYKSNIYQINNNEIGKITQSLYNELTGIQYGEVEDRHGWLYYIDS